MKIVENYSIGKIVTFVPNKRLPIYNWLYYKEGFSRQFMEYAFTKLKVSQEDIVLDPFLGSGTSALYCKEKGNIFYGMDINEVALFASEVKVKDYNLNELKKFSREFVKKPSKEYYVNAKDEIAEIKLKIIKKAFPIPVLQEILAYKRKFMEIENKKIRDFLLLALMNTSTITTYAEKHGGNIKINKSRKFPPVRKVLKKIVKKMISDLEKVKFNGKEKDIHIFKEDARVMNSIKESTIDVLITSPPYLNKIEYTNVYAIEQYLFLNKTISKPAVRSYIGEIIDEKKDVFKGKYPMNNISKAYFKDMYTVVKNLSRVMKQSSKGAIVIGNGCFPNGVVESDKLLAELLEREGFKVKEIERVNVRWCMRNRVIKVDKMHESIIWFER